MSTPAACISCERTIAVARVDVDGGNRVGHHGDAESETPGVQCRLPDAIIRGESADDDLVDSASSKIGQQTAASRDTALERRVSVVFCARSLR